MSHAAATSPAVNQVGLTGSPQAVAVDPATDTAYVAELAKSPPGNVAVIDLATNTVTTTITVGSRPSAVAVNPITGLVYVTNAASDSVSVINGATSTVTGTISATCCRPIGVAADPATGTVYAAFRNSH
jgi:YVTN family beta-propeller protein